MFDWDVLVVREEYIDSQHGLILSPLLLSFCVSRRCVCVCMYTHRRERTVVRRLFHSVFMMDETVGASTALIGRLRRPADHTLNTFPRTTRCASPFFFIIIFYSFLFVVCFIRRPQNTMRRRRRRRTLKTPCPGVYSEGLSQRAAFYFFILFSRRRTKRHKTQNSHDVHLLSSHINNNKQQPTALV